MRTRTRAAVSAAAVGNARVAMDAHKTAAHFLHLAQKSQDYVLAHGADPTDTFDVPKFD